MDATLKDGTAPLKLLYIDDEADKIAFIKGIFTPEGIDKFSIDSATLAFKVEHLCENLDALADSDKQNLSTALNKLLAGRLGYETTEYSINDKRTITRAISLLCPDNEFPSDSDKFQQFLMLVEQKMGNEYPLKQYDAKNAGALSESTLALLKRVEVETVLNNSSKQGRANDDEVPTPASKAARDIYEGKYDLVLTDMNMPLDNEHNQSKYSGTGGFFIANVAKIAGVPLVVHSYSSRAEIIGGLNKTSPSVLTYGHEPTSERKQFSESVRTPRKLSQRQVYESVAAELEKLVSPPQRSVA